MTYLQSGVRGYNNMIQEAVQGIALSGQDLRDFLAHSIFLASADMVVNKEATHWNAVMQSRFINYL